MRLIDADAFRDNVINKIDLPYNFAIITANLRKSLNEQPTIDAVPVVHDKWTRLTVSEYMGLDDNYEPKYCECVSYRHLKCGYDTILQSDYCPRCGAKMDGD